MLYEYVNKAHRLMQGIDIRAVFATCVITEKLEYVYVIVQS